MRNKIEEVYCIKDWVGKYDWSQCKGDPNKPIFPEDFYCEEYIFKQGYTYWMCYCRDGSLSIIIPDCNEGVLYSPSISIDELKVHFANEQGIRKLKLQRLNNLKK